MSDALGMRIIDLFPLADFVEKSQGQSGKNQLTQTKIYIRLLLAS